MNTRNNRNSIRSFKSFLYILLLLPFLMAGHCGDDNEATDDTYEASASELRVDIEPSYECCSLESEPGYNGIESCATGATCCADGTWQCNDELSRATCVDALVCTGP